MAEKEVTKTAASGNNKTNAILAWVFAPITSFIFKDDPDPFTKKVAKHSMYFGVAVLVVHVVLWVVGFIGSFFCFGFLCFAVDMVVWVADVAVRVIGAVKANKGELFEVPGLSGMVKE